MKLLICSFLQPPVTSSHFGPDILLNTLNTLSNQLASIVSTSIFRHIYQQWGGGVQNYLL
jgi:hypothetical protein